MRPQEVASDPEPAAMERFVVTAFRFMADPGLGWDPEETRPPERSWQRNPCTCCRPRTSPTDLFGTFHLSRSIPDAAQAGVAGDRPVDRIGWTGNGGGEAKKPRISGS